MFEAEVKKLSNPMVLKPIDRVDYECVCVALPTLSVYDVCVSVCVCVCVCVCVWQLSPCLSNWRHGISQR
jgi:hypothetical protein